MDLGNECTQELSEAQMDGKTYEKSNFRLAS